MKKILILTLCLLSTGLVRAQKVGYVDTEALLAKIPQYVQIQKQLENETQRYQQEIENDYNQLEQLFAQYQKEKHSLSAQRKQMSEQAILQKEEAVKEKQEKYFGQEGVMAKRSQEALQPIMQQVEQAIEAVALAGGYSMVMDVAAATGLIYKNPQYDLTATVLKKLGYKN